MGALDGRVAVVTGAGHGLGREHALLMAAHGAAVVVNDLGTDTSGAGADSTAARAVADEIVAAGGRAVANSDDVTTWSGARALIATAVEEFGELHVLVNNAGILRDRMLATMGEEDWDDVVRVHLRGHFATTRFAAEHWRRRHKEAAPVRASIVNTTSGAGLLYNPGQANYSAAKAGIVALTMVAAKELARYGVRANAIAPIARTRLTLSTPGLGESLAAPADGFDPWHPSNVSPLVAYLATESCPLTGAVLHVAGGQVGVFEGWRLSATFEQDRRWTVEDLAARFESGNPAATAGGADGRLPAEGMSNLEFQQVLAGRAAAPVG